ncbi:hypothetical protein VTK56DRAFT_1957 [Thermocarpiscus australiensis]
MCNVSSIAWDNSIKITYQNGRRAVVPVERWLRSRFRRTQWQIVTWAQNNGERQAVHDNLRSSWRYGAEATGERWQTEDSNDLQGESGVVRWAELSNSDVVRGKRMEESQESAFKVPYLDAGNRIDCVRSTFVTIHTTPHTQYLDFAPATSKAQLSRLEDPNTWTVSIEPCLGSIIPSPVSLRQEYIESHLLCLLAPTVRGCASTLFSARPIQRLHRSTQIRPPPAPPPLPVGPMSALPQNGHRVIPPARAPLPSCHRKALGYLESDAAQLRCRFNSRWWCDGLVKMYCTCTEDCAWRNLVAFQVPPCAPLCT